MRRSGLATTSGSAGTGPGNDTGVWLIMTIILFALLCNYSRTICLIDVGTEGIVESIPNWAHGNEYPSVPVARPGGACGSNCRLNSRFWLATLQPVAAVFLAEKSVSKEARSSGA